MENTQGKAMSASSNVSEDGSQKRIPESPEEYAEAWKQMDFGEGGPPDNKFIDGKGHVRYVHGGAF